MAHRLTKAQARRVALRAQLLDADRPTDLVSLVERLTLLQIDPVRVEDLARDRRDAHDTGLADVRRAVKQARRQTMPTTSITDVRTIGVNVTDQDYAIDFYVDTLGFEKRLDAPISPTMRWIEVAPRGATTSPDGNRFEIVEVSE